MRSSLHPQCSQHVQGSLLYSPTAADSDFQGLHRRRRGAHTYTQHVKMAADSYHLLSSMRARYWDGRAGYRAAPSGKKADAEQLNRCASTPLLSGYRAPEPEQQQLQPEKSIAVCDATPRAQLHARERAPSSGREATLPGLGPPEPVTPLRLHPASQRSMPIEQATAARQASTLSASQRCMPTGQDAAARQAPTLSVKGRGDLIASVVETGLQIATRMGNRAAAAALHMPEPIRATSSPAAQARPSLTGAHLSRSHSITCMRG